MWHGEGGGAAGGRGGTYRTTGSSKFLPLRGRRASADSLSIGLISGINCMLEFNLESLLLLDERKPRCN